ncbi:Hypothetical predicted protein [Paramuricea clavata]|uniref:Uncharacterized protein n=1 Tax=Paramuricea clavata TaxID=317549 RepID=A0A7D9DZF5_PARCT|nr:Hypothetical predicted protein [Paramuricea clavata]
MADTVGHNNSSKCRCCHQYIDKIKHAVNLFGDKSLKKGIKEGLELYSGIRVKENVNIDVLSYVCQQCYTLIYSIVERIKKLCGICSQSSVAGKRSVCQQSPSQLTLSPSCRTLLHKRQQEQSADIRHCLFPPILSSDILPRPLRPIQMDTVNQSETTKQNAVLDGKGILKESGLRNPKFMNSPCSFLDRSKVKRLVTIVNFGIPEDIGKEVMSMLLLKASIQHIILKELDEQCRNLCKIKKSGGCIGPSVLLVPSSNTQECVSSP